MKVEFADKRLALIRTAEAHKLGLPAGALRSCLDKLVFIEGASSERSLRNWKSLDYKKLEGSDVHQIRLNQQYRMRFKLDDTTRPPTIWITYIGDPH